MSALEEQNKALLRRAAETHNAREREAFLACYSDRLVVKSPSGDQVSITPDEHWQAVLSWSDRFEGFTEEIQEMVAEGDLVFLRSRYTGIHRKQAFGADPTNRRVSWEAWQVLRIQEGLIVEERMLMDLLGLLRQMDVERVPEG